MRIFNYIDYTPLITNEKDKKRFIKLFFIDFFFVVFLFIMCAIVATNSNLYKYLPIFVCLLIGDTLLSIAIIFFMIIKHRIKHNRESLIFADFSNIGLPLFKISRSENVLTEYYNNISKLLLWSRGLTIVMYAEKIKIKSKQNYTIKLYYIQSKCIVEVIDSDNYSWWGICEKFEEGQPIFELWRDFGIYYLDKLLEVSNIKVLDNSFITCAKNYDFISNADKF